MPDPNRKLIGWAVVAVCVVIVIVIASAIGGGNGGGSSPEKYLRKHFDHVRGSDPDSDSGIVFKDSASPAPVADKIAGGTDADENRADGSSHYLRYDDDWLVVVEPGNPSGSTITLYEYDRGYNHHVGVIGLWGWSSYYGRNSGGRDGGGSFRGGGSGFGK
ncbi:uncharacterized protein DUF4247 [Nocardioides albertanoniae]|uniref:Uncharacterized protein DUF4247 n=1 Tax=Nocardioides albertanoniae TaxID=1175486 RepID=A0A543A1R9_9ACTN|nr:DUF4247 domain-containing protein [Nocardioides albertanoniae]TQL66527.1 uncharacterized protein DUF4247 [Nocardioides albertanoniae]